MKLYRARRAASTTSTAWCSPTRACRRWSPATSTPRSSACAPAPRRCSRLVERYGLRDVPTRRSSGCSTTARRSCASYFEKIPDGRYVGQRRDGRQRRRPTSPSRSRSWSRSTAPTSGRLHRARPTRRPGRSTARSPSTVSASRVAITMLAGQRRGAERGPLPRRSRSSTRPGSMFHPLVAVAVLPLRLAGAAGDRGDLRRRREGDARGGPGLQRRRHLRAVWWGEREETGEPWADGSPHPVGQGAHADGDGANASCTSREAATRFSPAEVWEAKNPWLLEHVELGAGLRRRRPAPRRPRRRHLLPDARGRVGHLRGRAHEERRPGASRAAAPARPNGARDAPCPTGRARVLRQGDAPEGAEGLDVRALHRRRRRLRRPAERDPAAVHADVREGYITRGHARAGTTRTRSTEPVETPHRHRSVPRLGHPAERVGLKSCPRSRLPPARPAAPGRFARSRAARVPGGLRQVHLDDRSADDRRRRVARRRPRAHTPWGRTASGVTCSHGSTTARRSRWRSAPSS